MGHAQVANYTGRANNDWFNNWWKVSRCMLAAGWKYKASGDVNVKESAGLEAADRWAIGGATNTVQVGAQGGTSPIITTGANGVITLTGVSGFVANSVGRYIRLTGFGNDNDGIFRILSQGGTTLTYFNPNCPGSQTGGASNTWSERQGGAAATTALAGVAPATPGRVNITGLTGMRLPTANSRGSVGNRLTIVGAAQAANNGAWLITRVFSSTSVEIENPAGTGVSETNNGSIVWVEVDPLLQVFPVGTIGGASAGHWICLQGPSTLKVPLSNGVVTGTFRKGENVVQTTSGATGEVIGVVVDVAGSLGYLVIQPRLNGTGGGRRGWSNTDVITGSVSGATATAAGTVIEFVREAVFWKGVASAYASNGHVFYQTVDAVGEAAHRFSALATAGAVTASLAPGGPTGTFPGPGSYVMTGTGGSNSATSSAYNLYPSSSGTTDLAAAQMLCANCIGTAGVSEDGSWTLAAGSTGTQSMAPFGLQYCENSEDGDVDPYVGISLGYSNYAGTRTAPNTYYAYFYAMWTIQGVNTSAFWRGWRRRGMASGDAFQEFGLAVLGNPTQALCQYNSGNTERSACVPDPSKTIVRDQCWIISTQTNQKMRKGSLRWMCAIANVVPGALYDNGRFIGMMNGSSQGGFAVGPWDGQTAANWA